MKKSKVLSGLVTTLAFTAQTLAAAAPKPLTKEQWLEKDSAMAVILSINSTAPVEKAMEVLMPKEDVAEIKKFFEKKKIDISKMQMSDTPFFGGTIFYGSKMAEFQKDSAIRIDGHFYRYDKRLSPAQNYIRLFNAFSGHHETDKALLQVILPQAHAVDAPAYTQGMTYAEEALKKEAQAAYMEGTPLQRFLKSPSGKAPLNMYAQSSGAGAEAAGAKQAGKSFLGRMSERGGQLAKKFANAAKTGARGVRGAYWPAAGASLVTYLLWAGTAAAIRGANELYGWYWNGVMTCKPADPETGRSEYQFSFTNPNSTWYWRSTDTRDFTAEELADVIGQGLETYEQCMQRSSNSKEACDQSVKDQKTLPQNCTKTWTDTFNKEISSSEENIAKIRDGKKLDGSAAGAGAKQ